MADLSGSMSTHDRADCRYPKGCTGCLSPDEIKTALDELDGLSDMRLAALRIYRLNHRAICGHTYVKAIYADCKTAGRVAISHYVCAICGVDPRVTIEQEVDR